MCASEISEQILDAKCCHAAVLTSHYQIVTCLNLKTSARSLAYASDEALQNTGRQWLQRRKIVLVFQRRKTTGDKDGDCIEK